MIFAGVGGYNHNNMNITLIGMPGSGKTVIGKMLAGALGFEFFDSDAAIVREFGLPLPQVLENVGEKEFLKKEEMIVIAQTGDKDNMAISPGGSIVYSSAAMEHLKKISTIIYLKSSLPVIEARIKNWPRGIVGGKSKNIAQFYGERTPLYEKWADMTVDSNQEANKVAEAVMEKIKFRPKGVN